MKKYIICMMFVAIMLTSCASIEKLNVKTNNKGTETKKENNEVGIIDTNVAKTDDDNSLDKESHNEGITTKNATEKQNNEVVTTDNNVTKVDDNNLNKECYLEKLNKLKSDLENTSKKRYEGPSTLDMIEAGNAEYKIWDDMLNEVYSVLKEQLTKEQMDSLIIDEQNWIKIRDEKSINANKSNEGGTIAPLNQLMSLIESTRERCFELVEQYMK